MSPNYRALRVAALGLAGLVLSQANAAEPKLAATGWTSWQVPAVDNAPAWCCFANGDDSDASRAACRLDDRHDGWNIRNRDATTDAVKVYAKTNGGRIERLQVLSASCPVETSTPIQQLDGVTADESARWLEAQVTWAADDAITNQPLGQNALAALAMHSSDVASHALKTFARSEHLEMRKWSVFWLAQLRGAEGADITSSVMFNDKDSRVREHAAFALSQSHSPRVAPDLIRLGNTDKLGEVRAKAWFWLAHTGAPESEQAIGAALRKDSDHRVREQAIFALSRLPGERGTRALIDVAEDQSLSREERKKAIFWLAQSRSDSAEAYLEKVLAKR